MVSLFGRGFDSRQLHLEDMFQKNNEPQKLDHTFGVPCSIGAMLLPITRPYKGRAPYVVTTYGAPNKTT